MLIDTHCHLDSEVFTSDLTPIIERAIANRVEYIIMISTKIRQFPSLRKIAEQYDCVFCSVGTHPHDAEAELDIPLEELLELASFKKNVGIGETGLDYHYKNSAIAAQKQSFLMHIAAARQSALPLIIHSRDADDDMENILRQEMKKGPFSFVLHCYSSGEKLARTAIELGGYISFSGMITFKNSGLLREIAQTLPQDRILIETDAPYLAPVPYRGQRNEPCFIVETAKSLAEILHFPYEDMISITTRNALNLFNKLSSFVEEKTNDNS